MANIYFVAKVWKHPNIIIVPLRYVYKLDLAKSLNNRINRNQKHVVFWSEDDTKEPNFNLPVSNRFDRSKDSCLKVKILKVFSSHHSALNYAQRCRTVDPAVYNERRLYEKPYPALPKTIRKKKQQQPKNLHRLQRQNAANQLNIAILNVSDRQSNPTNSEIMLTPPNSPQVPSTQVFDEHDDLVDGGTIIDNQSRNEDVICLSERDNVEKHRPIKECDVISGRHSFDLTPKSDRVYKINGKSFQIKKDIVDRLLYYNKSPSSKNNTQIDKTFTELLLLSMFNVQDLKKGEIDGDLMNMIKYFYRNRIGRNRDRLKNFKKYVVDKCRELSLQ